MEPKDCHPAVRKVVQSALDQGCTILAVQFDPEGGIASQGYLTIDVEIGGKPLRNAGSGMINDAGEFEWFLRSSGPADKVVEPLPPKTGPVSFEEFDRTLRLFEALNNVVKIAMLLMPLMKRDDAITFPVVEKRLRELESKVHVLAAPLSLMAPDMPSGTRPEHTDGSPAKYWVWFGLHGPTEAAKTRKQFGSADATENLVRLQDSGFLILPENL